MSEPTGDFHFITLTYGQDLPKMSYDDIDVACEAIEGTEVNGIEVSIQHGPRKIHGINGTPIDSLIQICRSFLVKYNEDCPAVATAMAIVKLDEALLWLMSRTEDRTNRGVEGTEEK